MRKAIRLSILLLLFAVADAGAQTHGTRWPLWFIPSSVDRIHGIAIGPFHSPVLHPNDSTRGQIINGIAVELIGFGILAPLSPMHPVRPWNGKWLEEVIRHIRNRGGVNGIAISASGTEGLAFVNGIVVGGLCGWIMEVNGVSVHPYLNYSHRINGLGAGLINESRLVNGVQIGLHNRSEQVNGVQLGGFNRADTMSGVQIGLFNECYGSLHGIQIGLVNIGPGGWMPIVYVGF